MERAGGTPAANGVGMHEGEAAGPGAGGGQLRQLDQDGPALGFGEHRDGVAGLAARNAAARLRRRPARRVRWCPATWGASFGPYYMKFHATAPMSPPRQAQPPAFSPQEFRAALGMFATGVTIVTARTADGKLIGLTANSFNSVSLDPPLVLWSLARAAASLPAFSTGSHYAINILAADQKALAERFALKGADRWIGVDFDARRRRRAAAARAPPPPSSASTAAATRKATTSSSSAKSSAAPGGRAPRRCCSTAAASTPSCRSDAHGRRSLRRRLPGLPARAGQPRALQGLRRAGARRAA